MGERIRDHEPVECCPPAVPVKHGEHFSVELTIRDFGCLLQTTGESASLRELLETLTGRLREVGDAQRMVVPSGCLLKEPVGGPRKYNAHVKYFLMYPGLDRASTIGFRCSGK